LLITGGLAVLVRVLVQVRIGAIAPLILCVLSGFFLIKVAIGGYAGWCSSREYKWRSRNPISIILKIGALVMVLDATLLWSEVVMHQAGMITPSGKESFAALDLQLLIAGFTGLMVASALYRWDDHNAVAFGCLAALGNIVVNFIVMLLLIQGLRSLVAAKPAAVTAAPTASAASAGPSRGFIRLTAADRAIHYRISTGSPVVLDGRAWEVSPSGSGSKPTASLIDQMYALGVGRVYVDMEGVHGTTSTPPLPAKLYIELPISAMQRTACENAADAFCASNALAAPLPKEPGRFLIINLGN